MGVPHNLGEHFAQELCQTMKKRCPSAGTINSLPGETFQLIFSSLQPRAAIMWPLIASELSQLFTQMRNKVGGVINSFVVKMWFRPCRAWVQQLHLGAGPLLLCPWKWRSLEYLVWWANNISQHSINQFLVQPERPGYRRGQEIPSLYSNNVIKWCAISAPPLAANSAISVTSHPYIQHRLAIPQILLVGAEQFNTINQ